MKKHPVPNHKLRAARLLRCWTLEVAAEQSQVSIEAYSRWEYGQQDPRLSSLMLLCKGFGQTPEELGFEHLVKSSKIEDAKTEKSGQDMPLSSVSDQLSGETEETLIKDKLVVTQDPSMSFGELQEHVEQTLRRFLDMKQISRRSIIALLTSIPIAALTASLSGDDSSLLRDDEIVSLAAVNVPLVWRLYFSGGLPEVRETLPGYINTLTTLAQKPSRYQQKASGLASQAHQLGYLIGMQDQNFGVAMDHAKQSLHYAHLADDDNLRLSSLVRQGNLYHIMKRPGQTLLKYQEAVQYKGHVSPLVLGQAYIGLAEAYARTGQQKEADHYQGLARDTFPASPQEDLQFAYTHFNAFTRANFEGLMYIHLQKPAEAWNVFTEAEKKLPATLAPQKVELLVRQSLTLVTLDDMPAAVEHLEAATGAALKLGSNLRYQEASEIYDQMLLKWPHEQKVRGLEDLFA